MQAMFDRYPNMRVDITPGREMYDDFSVNPERTREFFEKNQGRIMLGTDNSGVNGELCDQGRINGKKKLEGTIQTKANGFFQNNRNRQGKYWMYESINETLKSDFYTNERIAPLLAQYEADILGNRISSFVAAKNLLDLYRS